MTNKKCRVYETLNSVKDLKIDKSSELMTLSGVFGECGKRNRNNRVYETSNYAAMVSEMQQRIKNEGGIPGELEHPQSMNITLENISHKIIDIQIDENGLVTGTIQLLNTPKGKIAQAIVEGGLPLYISSRATGQISKDGKVTLEKLSTYDLVGTPGFEQAKMHLNESLEIMHEEDNLCIIEENETNENNNDMNNEQIFEKISELEKQISILQEEKEELKQTIENIIESNTVKLDQDQVKMLAEGIQNWIIEEYSPEVQKWITEEFAPEHRDEIIESVSIDKDEILETYRKDFTESICPLIQNWIIEEYSPEFQNWITEEFAPAIQNWIVEEYSPDVQNWLDESYIETIKTKVKDIVNEAKANNLDSIDETLKLLENIEVSKPKINNSSVQLNEVNINSNEPYFIQNMPDYIRPLWNQASQEIKESINRRAKIYNFNATNAIEKFWESIDFANIKPINNIYEGFDNIIDEREKSIRLAFRKKAHVNYGLR